MQYKIYKIYGLNAGSEIEFSEVPENISPVADVVIKNNTIPLEIKNKVEKELVKATRNLNFGEK